MIDLSVLNPLAETRTEVVHIFQRECRHIFHLGCSDAKEICTAHVVQNERGTQILADRTDLHITHGDIFHMPQKESLRRHRTEHVRLRILILYFRRPNRSRLTGSATSMLNVYVTDLNVFNRMPRHAAKNRAKLWLRIGADDVADQNPAQRANRHARRTAHPAAQSHEDWSRNNLAHGDIRDRDVFQHPAIHGFQRQSLAALEDAVRNRNVLETAVRLSAEFDSTGEVVI